MNLVIYSFVFCIGLAIGSFLNVCIYRLPIKKSLLRPRSHCPHCGTSIQVCDNIPLLSYGLLRGRCRQCGARISVRYPLVEFFTAILFVGLFMVYGSTLQFLIYSLLVASLLVIALIDLDQSIIPDGITVPGIILGLLCSPLNADLGSGITGIKTSAVGFLAGGILFLLITIMGNAVFKKESMGGGDIKLAAMLGAFLGWKGALVSFFLAFLAGAIVGMMLLFAFSRRTATRVPFGPFLAIGAMTYIFFGEPMIRIYWHYVSLL